MHLAYYFVLFKQYYNKKGITMLFVSKVSEPLSNPENGYRDIHVQSTYHYTCTKQLSYTAVVALVLVGCLVINRKSRRPSGLETQK